MSTVHVLRQRHLITSVFIVVYDRSTSPVCILMCSVIYDCIGTFQEWDQEPTEAPLNLTGV